MGKLSKVLLYAAAVFLLIMGAGIVYVQANWDRTHDVPVDASFEVTSTPEAVENGRYLVYGPAHCAYCHTTPEQWSELDAGEEVPLSGGFSWELSVGKIYSTNLTPDKETGIGNVTDAELKRALRFNVAHDGRALFPFMDFHRMSDRDLHDVIAYLRSQPAVHNPIPEPDLNLTGKFMMSTVIEPVDFGEEAPEDSPVEEVSIERGKYLAENVAGCMGCHSQRNPLDGTYEGERFAGGLEQESLKNPQESFVSPNITPDPETGILAGWSEDTFVSRFKAGGGISGTPMPWGAYQRMSEEDLRSIYKYLQTLEPVHNEVGETFRDGE